MKRLLTLSLLLGFVYASYAQTNLNEYKYAVLPLQYEFLKGKDKYKLNTLARVLFKGEGFGVYFTEEQLPPDLFKDRCLAIYPDVKEVKGGFFRTKLKIIIKDCNGRLLFESKVGESKENNYQKAHQEALRDAFKSVEQLNYSYEPIEQIKDAEDLNEHILVKEEDSTEKVEQSDVEQKDDEATSEEKSLVNENSQKIYNAESFNSGFKLISTTSEEKMILLSTAAKDVFIVKDKNAIVFKLDGQWIYSENDGVLRKDNRVSIKFQ